MLSNGAIFNNPASYAVYLIRKTLLILAYLLYPLIDAVHRKFSLKSRTTALAFPFVLIFGLLAVFGVSIRHQVQSEAAQVAAQVKNPEFRQHLTEWSPLGIPVGKEFTDNSALSQGSGFHAAIGQGRARRRAGSGQSVHRADS